VEAEEVGVLPLQEAPNQLQRKSFRAMGCEMSAVLACQPGPACVLERVPEWFEEWEQALSRFRLDSELSQLNRQPDQQVRVSDTLWEVYQAAVMAEKFTHGLVTPTIAQAVLQAGYDRSFEELPQWRPDQAGAMPGEAPGLSLVLADPQSQSICLPPGLQLDFGGVAKGWAAHQAVHRLAVHGPALVDAGGDIAISGSLPGPNPWPVAVADPFRAGGEIAMLYVEAGGVATSGRDRRTWRKGSGLQHHIIDPRSAMPARTDLLAVTIVAPTVMQAEAAAKAALIMGSQAGIAWVQESPGLAGLFVLEGGEVLANERMQAYL
jgi:thiamine biosynthesis lipoprotein